MHSMRTLALTTAITVGALAASVGFIGCSGRFDSDDRTEASSDGADKSVPLSTPVGMTLVEVVRAQSQERPRYLWTRLGDATGRPLFTFDADAPGAPACQAECLKRFPPVIAPANAKPFDVWSLVERDHGIRQWTYRGKPLYLSTNESAEFQVMGVSFGSAPEVEDADYADPGSKLYAPAPGWRMAKFMPVDEDMLLPPQIDVSGISAASGYGLVTAAGMTLYTLDGVPDSVEELCSLDSACINKWRALEAPELAIPMGDFSPIRRTDGTKQWAYRRRPLYTFAGDRMPGDANGMNVAKQWRVALLKRNFVPSGVAVKNSSGHGKILSTSDGKTLYARNRFAFQYSGRNLPSGYQGPYDTGKKLGFDGCDAKCLEMWHPFDAAANSQSQGFWEIATAKDGSKYWAYKGYVLYTFAGDETPGAVNGNNIFEMAFGEDSRYDMAVTGGDNTIPETSYHSGAGLYWHVASVTSHE